MSSPQVSDVMFVMFVLFSLFWLFVVGCLFVTVFLYSLQFVVCVFMLFVCLFMLVVCKIVIDRNNIRVM